MAENPKGEKGLRVSDSFVETKPRLCVLHVDDSPDDLVLFQLACEQMGVPFDAHPVRSTSEAVSYLEQLLDGRPGALKRWPDLVLLDIVMPGRTGFELLRFLRETPELAALPVVAFTGDMNPAVVDEAYRSGANSCLGKPLTFGEMMEVALVLYQAWSLALRPSPPERRAE